MLIKIDKIRIAARIRKQTVKLDELAADIEKNGLLNPITVMPSGGEYQLLAGLRRLRAAQSLGWTEIEATAVTPRDAESAIHIEYSENTQREQFTFSEKMDYARLIEEIERAKAKERMSFGGKGGSKEGVDGRPHLDEGKSRDAIGEKVGMSGRNYSRAKFVAENAPQSVVEELDNGECTIYGAYENLRTPAMIPALCEDSPPPTHTDHTPDAPRESDLDRAIRAESELDAYKYRRHNEIYHRDGIIENLRLRVAELESALDAANARIRELEARYEPSGKGVTPGTTRRDPSDMEYGGETKCAT